MLFGRHTKNPIRIADKGVVDWKYTTCGYCSTGCSIEVGLDANSKAVASRGVADAAVNQGKLCIKGIFEHELFDSANRGTTPLLRERRIDSGIRPSIRGRRSVSPAPATRARCWLPCSRRRWRSGTAGPAYSASR